MATKVNNASPASSGITIGAASGVTRDPDYSKGVADRVKFIQGEHENMAGQFTVDFVTTKRRPRHVKFTALPNADWAALRTYLVGGTLTYWRFPHESSDFVAIVKDLQEGPHPLKGDAVLTPHMDVEFDLYEK